MADLVSDNPVLRSDINLVPVQGHDGSSMIVARDPLELSGKGTVAIRPETLGVLALLDGTHSIEDIRVRLVEQTARAGQLTAIPIEVVQSFIGQLSEAYLLDDERYRKALDSLIHGFKRMDVRPATLAGKSYPHEKQTLEQFIDEVLASDIKGSGLEDKEKDSIVALVCPHIELRIGESLYAASYNTVKGRSYDRVVILGVGHNLQQGIFCLTDKDFSTPLGTVTTDRLAVERLRKAAGPLAAEDDFAHRDEHSIEFQLIFLQHVLKGPFTIVPVLCGSLHEHLLAGENKRPREAEELTGSLDSLAEMLSDPGCRTLVVAAVDFSHVGPKFGDNRPAAGITDESTKHDKALITALAALDIEAFCAEGRQVNDRYHVCGFSVLSMLLEVLPANGVKGLALGHELWNEDATKSAVSFSSVVFYRK
ncbi:MAG: AmmeMemoRadiSam system protein B [Gemmatimonadota bacterium]|nr:AmmeMemoRadiSam system protein B [Gemmatimonadota bacterium]